MGPTKEPMERFKALNANWLWPIAKKGPKLFVIVLWPTEQQGIHVKNQHQLQFREPETGRMITEWDTPTQLDRFGGHTRLYPIGA